jgi:hypothetical protein
LISCLLNRKTEGFRQSKTLKNSEVKVPLTWLDLNNDEVRTISEDLIKDIERKLQVDADEINYIKEHINVDYKKSKIIKIKDRKVKLGSVVRSLDDWNKKFDREELKN